MSERQGKTGDLTFQHSGFILWVLLKNKSDSGNYFLFSPLSTENYLDGTFCLQRTRCKIHVCFPLQLGKQNILPIILSAVLQQIKNELPPAKMPMLYWGWPVDIGISHPCMDLANG